MTSMLSNIKRILKEILQEIGTKKPPYYKAAFSKLT
jgi:hypothetical protein